MSLLTAPYVIVLNVGRGRDVWCLRLVQPELAGCPALSCPAHIWLPLPRSRTALLGRAPRSSRSLSSDSWQLTLSIKSIFICSRCVMLCMFGLFVVFFFLSIQAVMIGSFEIKMLSASDRASIQSASSIHPYFWCCLSIFWSVTSEGKILMAMSIMILCFIRSGWMKPVYACTDSRDPFCSAAAQLAVEHRCSNVEQRMSGGSL